MNKQLITIFSIFSITCLGMVSAQESKSFLPEVKKESLTFSSEDNKFKLTFNGRIQADGAMFFGEDYQPIGNGVGSGVYVWELLLLLAKGCPVR